MYLRSESELLKATASIVASDLDGSRCWRVISTSSGSLQWKSLPSDPVHSLSTFSNLRDDELTKNVSRELLEKFKSN